MLSPSPLLLPREAPLGTPGHSERPPGLGRGCSSQQEARGRPLTSVEHGAAAQLRPAALGSQEGVIGDHGGVVAPPSSPTLRAPFPVGLGKAPQVRGLARATPRASGHRSPSSPALCDGPVSRHRPRLRVDSGQERPASQGSRTLAVPQTKAVNSVMQTAGKGPGMLWPAPLQLGHGDK